MKESLLQRHSAEIAARLYTDNATFRFTGKVKVRELSPLISVNVEESARL